MARLIGETTDPDAKKTSETGVGAELYPWSMDDSALFQLAVIADPLDAKYEYTQFGFWPGFPVSGSSNAALSLPSKPIVIAEFALLYRLDTKVQTHSSMPVYNRRLQIVVRGLSGDQAATIPAGNG